MSGRRSNKTPDERAEDLKKAVNRSGFTEQEVYSILYKWYGRNASLFAFATALYSSLNDLVADMRIIRKCRDFDGCDVCKAEIVLLRARGGR